MIHPFTPLSSSWNLDLKPGDEAKVVYETKEKGIEAGGEENPSSLSSTLRSLCITLIYYNS